MPKEAPDNFKAFHLPDNMFNVHSVDFNIFIEYQAPFSLYIGGRVRICAAVNPVMRGYLQGYILSPRMNVSQGNGRPALGLMLGHIGKLLNDCASFIMFKDSRMYISDIFFIVYHHFGYGCSGICGEHCKNVFEYVGQVRGFHEYRRPVKLRHSLSEGQTISGAYFRHRTLTLRLTTVLADVKLMSKTMKEAGMRDKSEAKSTES